MYLLGESAKDVLIHHCLPSGMVALRQVEVKPKPIIYKKKGKRIYNLNPLT